MFTACASRSITSPLLEQSKEAYEKSKDDAALNTYATASMFQAKKLYALSKNAKTLEEAEHFAYLLRKELLVAKESTQEQKLSQKLQHLREEKTKVLLSQKENEIQKAKEEARLAKEEATNLAQKYQELQELNAKMTHRGLVLTLGDVLFDVGQSTLTQGAGRALDKLVNFLSENPQRMVLIEGHTDNVGSTTYNIDLSLRRAEAVTAALVEKGIENERIVTKGYGEAYPIADNNTALGKQQNRRVEIVVLNEGDTVESVQR